MRVRVLYFSSVKDKLKLNSEDIQLQGETVRDLVNTLVFIHPELKEDIQKVMFAVNEEYATIDTVLKDGDTVAVIPPVSGG